MTLSFEDAAPTREQCLHAQFRLQLAASEALLAFHHDNGGDFWPREMMKHLTAAVTELGYRLTPIDARHDGNDTTTGLDLRGSKENSIPCQL